MHIETIVHKLFNIGVTLSTPQEEGQFCPLQKTFRDSEHTLLYSKLDNYHMEIHVSGYIKYIMKYSAVFLLCTTTTTECLISTFFYMLSGRDRKRT